MIEVLKLFGKLVALICAGCVIAIGTIAAIEMGMDAWG